MSAMDLPLPFTSFIGREREVADVRRLVATSRLVTITGPGGSGKTRLALEVAHAVGADFRDGVHFVSLGAIHDATFFIPTLTQALGVVESPDQMLLDSLKAFLRDRHTLLLLDNFEQIIAAAPLLSELLTCAHEVKLLVTSREGLRLRGEREFALAPLPLFGGAFGDEQASMEDLRQVPSVALFMERAQAIKPDLAWTEMNATVVAQICARLDGLPLAIELAAARIKLLPPWALLARLEESPLQLLTVGPRDLPARQQTLHATVQWSYQLLDAREQAVFRALSCFVDGCTLAAASEIGSKQLERGGDRVLPARDDLSSPLLDLLTSLVDKNLLRLGTVAGETRLSLLETIREFGQQQLAGAGEGEAVRRDHAAYYLALAEEAAPQLMGAAQKAWLQKLERERENMRAAIGWGLEQLVADGDRKARVAFVLRLTSALWRFWYLRGRFSEGRRWLVQALEVAAAGERLSPVDKALKANVILAAATIIRRQNDLARARLLCTESIALFRALGDREWLVAALLQMVRVRDFQGDYDDLPALIAETLRLAEALPDGRVKACAYLELTVIDAGGMDRDTVATYWAEAERIHRTINDPTGLAYTLFVQAGEAEQRGDRARADALRAEVERLAAEVDDAPLQGRIASQRPLVAWQRGEYAAARDHIEDLLILNEERDRMTAGQQGFYLGVLAVVLHAQHLPVWAARIYGLVDSLGEPGQASMMHWAHLARYQKQILNTRSAVRAHLGDHTFATALGEGQAMTVDDILAIPHPSAATAEGATFEPLTAREMDVLRLLAQELSNPEIATRLVVSRRTVDAHLRAIYGKLDVHSRDAAVRVAQEIGLIT